MAEINKELLIESNSAKPEGEALITDPKSKAALVVVSLGADRASQIYKYLNEEDIEELTYEVAKLGKTSNTQVEGTLVSLYPLVSSSQPSYLMEGRPYWQFHLLVLECYPLAL